MKNDVVLIGADWGKESEQRVMICHWETNMKHASGAPLTVVDCAAPSTADEVKALEDFMKTRTEVIARTIQDITQTQAFYYLSESIYGMPWQLIRRHNRSNKKAARLKHSLTNLKHAKIPVWNYKLND